MDGPLTCSSWSLTWKKDKTSLTVYTTQDAAWEPTQGELYKIEINVNNYGRSDLLQVQLSQQLVHSKVTDT